MRLEAGITAAGNGGLHTELRVAGAAKKIFYFFSKKRYTFKISAFSRLGIRAGLRRLLQILLGISYT